MTENGNGKCQQIPTIIAINKPFRPVISFCKQFPDEERVLVPVYYTKLAIVWVPAASGLPMTLSLGQPYVATLKHKLMAFNICILIDMLTLVNDNTVVISG